MTTSKRVLVYTCCNKKYEQFIPLFAASILFSNTNTDIEIGISSSSLPKATEEALDKLRELDKDSTIHIAYNSFSESGHLAIYNKMPMQPNTVRFIRKPDIHDYYTYISDIDIAMLDRDFYKLHIENMEKFGMVYSNAVRTDETHGLTGLHFCITDDYFNNDISGVDVSIGDEIVLRKIQEKSTQINPEYTYRPVHGVHFSMARAYPYHKVNPCWIWEGESGDWFEKQWTEFKHSEEFSIISPALSEHICKCIYKLEKTYQQKPWNN